MHFHIKQWAEYRLVDLRGMQVAYGHKQSFCLEDNVVSMRPARERHFPTEGGRCTPLLETPLSERLPNGLSVGWGDEYPTGLRCQYIDLGPADPSAPGYLDDGDYDLILSVNSPRGALRLWRESDYTNNTVQIRVRVAGNTVVSLSPRAPPPDG